MELRYYNELIIIKLTQHRVQIQHEDIVEKSSSTTKVKIKKNNTCNTAPKKTPATRNEIRISQLGSELGNGRLRSINNLRYLNFLSVNGGYRILE